MLLEREEPLSALESALARAREGRGHTVLVAAHIARSKGLLDR